MSNAEGFHIGEVRCHLIVKNLPRVTKLNLSNIFFNLVNNNLSDLAVRSILHLRQLAELRIGTHTLIQVGTTSATRRPNSSQRFPSSPRLISVFMSHHLDSTKITRGGLLALCRLKLTYLSMGKLISNIERNNYGDEGALVVARHLPNLQELWGY